MSLPLVAKKITNEPARSPGQYPISIIYRRGGRDIERQILRMRDFDHPAAWNKYLVTCWLILKLAAFSHGYKAPCASQNLLFERTIVEGIR